MMIREMTIDDLPQVMEIEAEAFSVPWDETGFFTYLLRDDTIFLIAEEQGRLCGFCGILICGEDSDVLNLAVLKAKQGSGLGQKLLELLIHAAREKGVRHIYLEVRESNAAARHLYGKVGFTELGYRRDYYSDPIEDAITMSLQ